MVTRYPHRSLQSRQTRLSEGERERILASWIEIRGLRMAFSRLERERGREKFFPHPRKLDYQFLAIPSFDFPRDLNRPRGKKATKTWKLSQKYEREREREKEHEGRRNLEKVSFSRRKSPWKGARLCLMFPDPRAPVLLSYCERTTESFPHSPSLHDTFMNL